MTKKSYIVPESAIMQVLEQIYVMSGTSDPTSPGGGGSGPIGGGVGGGTDNAHSPGRKPF